MSNPLIYESPDGGDTVYVRKAGSTQRVLHSISEQRRTVIDELRESQLWGRIHRSADTDPVLKDMLEQVKVYWQLKHNK